MNEARGEEINVHQSGELPAADENEDAGEDEATAEENESAEEPGDEAGQQIHFVSEENNREIYELVNADQFLLKLAVVDGGTSWVSVRGSDGKEIQQATLISIIRSWNLMSVIKNLSISAWGIHRQRKFL